MYLLLEGRHIPTELRNETEQLRHSMQYDDIERVSNNT